MEEVSLLLRAYYELLYEKLENCRDILTEKVEKTLSDEIARRDFGNLDDEKYAAYKEACIAFIDERIESYNPVGVQYTFDNIRSRWVQELSTQLDWYDSRAEFTGLLEIVRKKCEHKMTNERICELAKELTRECGAFPDSSIISTYEKAPALNKLPDYIVARVIEDLIR